MQIERSKAQKDWRHCCFAEDVQECLTCMLSLLTNRTLCCSPSDVRGLGRMVSMPCRLPYTMSVRYLSPIIISFSLEHLQHHTDFLLPIIVTHELVH